MARLHLFAALPVIGLLMCNVAHAESKAPPTPPAAPPTTASAPTPPPAAGSPPAKDAAKDHVMHANELLHKNGPTEAERKAEHEALRKKFEAMTPEQRKAFFEERRKEMQARIDAMTPEEREALKKRMEEGRLQAQKDPSGMPKPPMAGKPPEGKPPEGAPPVGAPPPPPHAGKPPEGKPPEGAPPPPHAHEKGQPPAGGQPPHSDKH